MKKFMKALAFATVMCMLLSTAAFATDPAATLDQTTDYKFDVVVTTASNEAEQVSLLVVKRNATLANLQNTDILFVGQTESASGEATFEDVVVDSAKVTDGKVDIYAGYASANGPAVCCDDFSVVNAQELAITLADDMQVILDVAAWVELNGTDAQQEIEKPDREIATMVLATVDFANVGNNVIDRVGWEIATNEGKTIYIDLDASGYDALVGPVRLGVSFTNGWQEKFAGTEGYKAPLTFEKEDVKLWFRVNDGTADEQHIQATAE